MDLGNLFSVIPDSWVPILKSLGWSLVILIAATFVHRFGRKWLTSLTKRRRLAASVDHILRLIFRWGIVVIALLLVLQQFGVLKNFWTAVGAALALVAVGFVALWSVASNLLCTILILVSRPFRMGDWLEIPADSLEGEVVDLNMLFTTLRSDDDFLVHVPNNTFFQKAIKRKPAERYQEQEETNRQIEAKPERGLMPEVAASLRAK